MKLSKITPMPRMLELHGGKIQLGTVGNSECSIILKEKKSALAAEALELIKSNINSNLFTFGNDYVKGKVKILEKSGNVNYTIENNQIVATAEHGYAVFEIEEEK